MPSFPSQDLTLQYISESYQNVVQKYVSGSTFYFLDGRGNVIAGIASASVGKNFLTSDQSASMTVLSASFATTSTLAQVADVALLADTASVSISSVSASFATTASYAQRSLSASFAPTPDLSKYATTGSNNFSGSEFILAPLVGNTFTHPLGMICPTIITVTSGQYGVKTLTWDTVEAWYSPDFQSSISSLDNLHWTLSVQAAKFISASINGYSPDDPRLIWGGGNWVSSGEYNPPPFSSSAYRRGITVIGDVVAPKFIGTASNAYFARSASFSTATATAIFALSADYATTAGDASTANSALTAESASYALNATFAETASMLLGAVENSTFSVSASFASASISASYSVTASYAANVPSTASYALQALSASYAPSAPSISASYALQSLSASYAPFTQTVQVSASYASQSLSASYSTVAGTAQAINFVPTNAISASWVSASVRITTADTASYVAGANVIGNVANADYATNAGGSDYVLGTNVDGAVPLADVAGYADEAGFANTLGNTPSVGVSFVSSYWLFKAPISASSVTASLLTYNIILGSGSTGPNVTSSIITFDSSPRLATSIRNGGTSSSLAPQALHIANYHSSSANFERAAQYWSGSQYYITTEQSGSGRARDIVFQTSGSNWLYISGSGNVGIGTNVPSCSLDISSSNATFVSSIGMTPYVNIAGPSGRLNHVVLGNGSNGSGQIRLNASNALTLNASTGLSCNGQVIHTTFSSIFAGTTLNAEILVATGSAVQASNMFRVSSGRSATPHLIVSPSGSVGINVSAVTNSLDVGGNISCSVVTASLFTGTANTASLLSNFVAPIRIISSSYTLTTSDYTIICNNTASITASLPSISGTAGRLFNIKSVNSSSILVSGSSMIDGGTSILISAQYSSLSIQSDGTQWWII